MTQEEKKYYDEKFDNLKDFLTEKINNVVEKINNYMNTSDNRHRDQQADISILYGKANENEKSIIRLEGDMKEIGNKNEKGIIKLQGDIENIKQIKKAENGVKEKGLKTWQFVLGLSIPILISLLTSGIIYFITTKP